MHTRGGADHWTVHRSTTVKRDKSGSREMLAGGWVDMVYGNEVCRSLLLGA